MTSSFITELGFRKIQRNEVADETEIVGR